jgi:hypothetical protein
MTTNVQLDEPLFHARRRGRRFRFTGVILLVLGIAGAGVVYWLGSRAPGFADDLAMVGFNRSEDRQMGLLYGKQGRLIEDLTHALKQPGTQAFLIVAAAAVIAAGCFYFARILEDEAKQAQATGPNDG